MCGWASRPNLGCEAAKFHELHLPAIWRRLLCQRELPTLHLERGPSGRGHQQVGFRLELWEMRTLFCTHSMHQRCQGGGMIKQQRGARFPTESVIPVSRLSITTLCYFLGWGRIHLCIRIQYNTHCCPSAILEPAQASHLPRKSYSEWRWFDFRACPWCSCATWWSYLEYPGISDHGSEEGGLR